MAVNTRRFSVGYLETESPCPFVSSSFCVCVTPPSLHIQHLKRTHEAEAQGVEYFIVTGSGGVMIKPQGEKVIGQMDLTSECSLSSDQPHPRGWTSTLCPTPRKKNPKHFLCLHPPDKRNEKQPSCFYVREVREVHICSWESTMSKAQTSTDEG